MRTASKRHFSLLVASTRAVAINAARLRPEAPLDYAALIVVTKPLDRRCGAIVQNGVETVADAIPVEFLGLRGLFEGRQIAAARPSRPDSELGYSLGARSQGNLP